MGAAHYLPTVGTPLLIKPLHDPIRRHDTCSAALSQPTHTPSLCICWQDVTRMKRWCRLSALQAKQALGHVHTWHCGASASASATAVPLPTSLPKASSVCCALDLTCAALEPRPTHHLLVAPAPAQAFAGTALLAFPPDPATLNLSLRRRTPSPPLPARPSPLAPSSPPPPSPSYPSHCLKRSTISALPTMSPTMSFIVSSLLPSLWFKV